MPEFESVVEHAQVLRTQRWRELRCERITVALLAACGVFSACADADDGLDCDRVRYETCNIRSERCQHRVFDQMRCLRGDEDEAQRPEVAIVAQEELRQELARALEETQIDADEQHVYRALSLIGMIAEEDLSFDAQVEIQVDGLLGFYSNETRQIVVVDSGQPLDDQDTVNTLGHEYVHALQDQEFSLREYREQASATIDSMLSATSVIEGEAMLYDQFQLAALNGADPFIQDWPELFEAATDYADTYGSELSSPIFVANSLFPYTYGAHTSALGWDEGGQPELIRGRERDLFTQGFMARRHGHGVGAASTPDFEEVENAVVSNTDDRRSLGSDSLGAWLLHMFVVQVLGHPTEPDLALEWEADVMSIFVNDATDTAEAVWLIEWSDPTHARTFSEEVALRSPPASGTWQGFSDGAMSGIVASAEDMAALEALVAAVGGPPVSPGTDDASEVAASATIEPEDGGPAPSSLSPLQRVLSRRARRCLH